MSRVALALLASGLVAWWFALHPQPLLLGTVPQAELVPWWYQAAAFPPFFLLTAQLVANRRLAPALLLAGASAVAVIRLAGLIPLSGHATFLSAAAAFTFRKDPLVFAAALGGLAVTTFYKLRWGDELYFLLSLCVGLALGLSTRRLQR